MSFGIKKDRYAEEEIQALSIGYYVMDESSANGRAI
jgi:hypothetical protein